MKGRAEDRLRIGDHAVYIEPKKPVYCKDIDACGPASTIEISGRVMLMPLWLQ